MTLLQRGLENDTHGYAVAVKRVRISCDAGRAGGSPYLEDGRTFVRFCDDEPGGITGASAKRGDETVFRTEDEAERAVSALLARNAAKARTEKSFRPGLASQLAPAVIGGLSIGGYSIVSRAALVAERAEEVKLAEAKVRAKLALETERAAKQQALVDKIAAELKDAKVLTTPSGDWLRHADEKGIQQRTTQEGTTWYRRRVTRDSRTLTSPSFEQLADAVAWEPGEQPAPAPLRVGVGVVDPDELGLPQ